MRYTLLDRLSDFWLDLVDLPRTLAGRAWYELGRLLNRWAHDDVGRR